MSPEWSALEACLSWPIDAARCHRALARPTIDWVRLASLANTQFVAPALGLALRDGGLLPLVPEDLSHYLALLGRSNMERNARIARQCELIGAALAEAGLSAGLLKGAAWLFDGHEEARADRMMRDIDLLVAPESLDRAVAVLQAAGFRDTTATFVETTHYHHAPLLPPPGGETSVELHKDVAHRSTLLPTAEILAAAQPVMPGLLLPAPAHRILHAIIHDRIENGGWHGGTTDLRDTLDLSRLLWRYGAEIDWPSLVATARKRRYGSVVSGAIHMAHATLGAPLPEPLAGDARGRLHAWRCAQQRRWKLADAWLRRIGQASRALAWERDAYGLGLPGRFSPAAQIEVNRRRLRRIAAAWRRFRQPDPTLD